MIPRSLAVPTLLAASVAVPYVASNVPQWKEQWATAASSTPGLPATSARSTLPPWPAGLTRPPAPIANPLGLAQPGASAPTALPPAPTPLEGLAVHSLADVMRLDVTKEWVYQHWPRKSTALSDLDLFGVRVPLVTGTRLTDLAGSLTYFFANDGRVQRISFRGRTGDTTELIGLATQRFGLTWQAPTTAGEQLLQHRKGDDILSEVRTRPAPVLWTNAPQESFTVEMELQDPARSRPLPSKLLPLPPPAGDPAALAAPAAPKSPNKPAAKSNEDPWNPFFPRSRVAKPQINNLNRNDMFR